MYEPRDPLNTHSYDGKIDITQLADLPAINQLSFDHKKERGVQLLTAVKGKIDCKALSYLTAIVNSMGSSANVDNTNRLVADDLICLCWVYRENHDFIAILEMQLLDMATGFCPQGRTHRLFQTLIAFV